jgi:hypothetical protein
MEEPLDTSTRDDIRSKYPFFDPEIPTHIKTNGFALAGSDGQFDLVALYEEHKMPELDLTKPLRIRHEVNYDPRIGERFYYAGVNDPNGYLAGFVLDCDGNPWTRLMKPGDLENIPPEPVKHVYYLCFNESDKGASLYAHNNYSPLFKPSMAKILIWVEEGKTKVEVCDE